jgi:hypothetical protein
MLVFIICTFLLLGICYFKTKHYLDTDSNLNLVTDSNLRTVLWIQIESGSTPLFVASYALMTNFGIVL